MMNKSEGNLIGFRIFFDSSGNLMSEFHHLPEQEVSRFFRETEEQKIIRKVLEEATHHLSGLHEKKELELDALNFRIS
mgnify:CR=1 FL=1